MEYTPPGVLLTGDLRVLVGPIPERHHAAMMAVLNEDAAALAHALAAAPSILTTLFSTEALEEISIAFADTSYTGPVMHSDARRPRRRFEVFANRKAHPPANSHYVP